MKTRYKIITTHKEIQKLIDNCKKTGYCSFDFETTDVTFIDMKQYITIVGISFQIGSAFIIPLGHKESVFRRDYGDILLWLSRELFENKDIVKIAWNMKYEEKWLTRYGCGLKGRCFDGMLAKYSLNEERPNDLKSIGERFFPTSGGYEDEVKKIAAKEGWANVPLNILSKYCAQDADLTLRLTSFFERKLMYQPKLYNIFRNLLMPASHVLAESEYRGIDIDVPYLDKLIKEYAKKIEQNDIKLRAHKSVRRFEKAYRELKIKKLITAVNIEIKELEGSGKPNAQRLITGREEKISRYLAGEFTTNKEKKIIEPINFNSPGQMVDLLYGSRYGLGFPIIEYTKDEYKRDTDRPSTAEDTLEKLKQHDKDGFITQLLDHRGLSKLYSTYMVGMRTHVMPDDRIHGGFLLHGTVTARLSSRDPNLQNIPRGDNEDAAKIKKMFIAPKGYSIMQVDYSQAELRVMAEAADEKSMIQWFNTGRDIHLASACKKYSYDYDKALKIYSNEKDPEFKLWKKRRKQAKTINFGIIYCQMANKLSQSLSEPAKDGKPAIIVSKEEAQQFLNEFNRDFPNVGKFIRDQKLKAYNQGYVESFFGRKRRLPNIYNENDGVRMEAERQAVNAPIQSTASDFALFSSIMVRDYYKRNQKFEWHLQQIFTVHDSLGYLIKTKYLKEAVPIIMNICSNPKTQKWFGFKMKKVSIAVDSEAGLNWKELHGIKQ